MPSFPDVDALNAWLEEQCIAQWGQIQHGALPGTIADVHAAEITSLMQMGRPFDGFVEHTKRVSPTCLVAFERNRYSVECRYAGCTVGLRAYATRIVVGRARREGLPALEADVAVAKIIGEGIIPGGMALASGLALGFIFSSGALGLLYTGHLAELYGFPFVLVLTTGMVLLASPLALLLKEPELTSNK